jgi:RNA polymerase sigma factor (sigma-70 family)
MVHAPLGTVLRQIRTLADPEPADRELLQRFVTQHDPAAFAALVRRHGPLVLGVCRHVLQHVHDAEDAFQATFLVLAQSAASVRKGDALACWLHGVAYRVAMRAKRDAARRRHYEKQVPPRAHPSWDQAWREVQAVLDEEIQRLPETYRGPFILCCLDGKSRAEAAAELGLKEGTVWSRLAEARRRLQQRLARRGVTLTAVLGALAVSQTVRASAVPAGLVNATVQGVALGPPILSTRVSALAEGVGMTLVLTRWKLATLVLAAVGLLAAGGGLWGQRPDVPQPIAAQQPKQAAPAPVKPATPAAARKPKSLPFLEEDGEQVTLRGQVLGPDGKPFAGARIYLAYHTVKQLKHPLRATSRADGRFRFTYSKAEFIDSESINWRGEPWRYYDVLVTAPGYGPSWVWMPEVKDELKLQLVKDDVTVRGRVVDLQGRPVIGATVQVLGPPWATVLDDVTTDRNGRFIIRGIGRDRSVELRVSGPTIELKRVGVTTHSQVGGKPADQVTVEVVAGPTKPIAGTVRARDTGKPLAGALVRAKLVDPRTLNDDVYGVAAITDDQGRYRLLGMSKLARYEVTVYPLIRDGYLFATQWVGDTDGLKPIDLNFSLRRGVPVRFRLLDPATRRPVHGIAQYTLARANPLWTEACAPFTPEFILPPKVWFHSITPDADGYFRFVAYPGHGAVFATAGHGIGPYAHAQLRAEDKTRSYYPLGKGEPNNGFLDIVNGYHVIDTDRTDRPLSFDILLTK